MQLLFMALKDSKYETPIKLATVLVLRRGEVLGLQNSDYDSVSHCLRIQRQVSIVKDNTLSEIDGQIFGVKDLKTECSKRTLYISSDIEKLIERQITYNQLQKDKLGDDYHDNGFICCKDNGDFINPQTLYYAFKNILKKNNLPNIRFHDLRHSYATMLIDFNIPLKVISQTLGHSSTAITDQVYADSIRAKQNVSQIVSLNIKCS